MTALERVEHLQKQKRLYVKFLFYDEKESKDLTTEERIAIFDEILNITEEIRGLEDMRLSAAKMKLKLDKIIFESKINNLDC